MGSVIGHDVTQRAPVSYLDGGESYGYVFLEFPERRVHGTGDDSSEQLVLGINSDSGKIGRSEQVYGAA